MSVTNFNYIRLAVQLLPHTPSCVNDRMLTCKLDGAKELHWCLTGHEGSSIHRYFSERDQVFDIFQHFRPAILTCYRPRMLSYDGRLCFHRCVSVQLSGGGVPRPRSEWGGGTPCQVWVGGTPFKVWVGVPCCRSGWGIPCSRSGWGVPHPRSGQGVPGVPPWPGLDGERYPGCPWPGLDGGGYPHHQEWMGYPPPPPPIRQSSIASTCYTAGGMPLAFTQEDFLVTNKIGHLLEDCRSTSVVMK